MATTIERIKAADISAILEKEFEVTPQQELRITFEVIEPKQNTTSEGDGEFDIENLGDALIESFEELLEAKKQGKKLTNAKDFLKTL